MDNFDGKRCGKRADFAIIYECEKCGKQVNKTYAELLNRVCPNCLGRLYRIT